MKWDSFQDCLANSRGASPRQMVVYAIYCVGLKCDGFTADDVRSEFEQCGVDLENYVQHHNQIGDIFREILNIGHIVKGELVPSKRRERRGNRVYSYTLSEVGEKAASLSFSDKAKTSQVPTKPIDTPKLPGF